MLSSYYMQVLGPSAVASSKAHKSSTITEPERSTCQHPLDHRKSRGIPEKHLTLFHWLGSSLWVYHNRLWKTLKEMGIPDNLTCLLGNVFAGQEATVRTLYEKTDWFRIEKGVRQGCLLSPCLINICFEWMHEFIKDKLWQGTSECRNSEKGTLTVVWDISTWKVELQLDLEICVFLRWRKKGIDASTLRPWIHGDETFPGKEKRLCSGKEKEHGQIGELFGCRDKLRPQLYLEWTLHHQSWNRGSSLAHKSSYLCPQKLCLHYSTIIHGTYCGPGWMLRYGERKGERGLVPALLSLHPSRGHWQLWNDGGSTGMERLLGCSKRTGQGLPY